MAVTSRRELFCRWLATGLLLAIMLYVCHILFPSTVQDGVIQNDLPQQGNWLEDIKAERATLRADTQSQCTEVTHLVYIKVPKTGSGTMTSILNHFGFVRNLTFALSKYGTHFKVDPILKQDILPIADGKHYDLLVNHATYNRETVREVFPKDTKLIATVREPFSNFISAFYFHFKFAFQSTLPKSLRDSTNSTRQIEWHINNRYQNISKMSHSVLNQQFSPLAVRLGIQYNMMLNVSYIQTYIDSVLDKDFDFVLVQEYFDESLILLKRYFCWTLDDIIYLSHHINRKSRTDHVYTEDLLQKHKEIAVAEFLIYDHFYKKFWEAVGKEGPTFFNEVRVFKEILNRVQSFCMRKPPDKELLLLPSSAWNSPFTITANRCNDLQKEIVEFTYLQKLRQQKEIPNPYSHTTTET